MKINDVAHFSLFMGTNTYILQTHTHNGSTTKYSSFLGYTSKYSTAMYEVYSGEGRIRCFLGNVRSSPSGTSPAKNRAPSGLSDARCCEDQITDSGGSTQEHARRGKQQSNNSSPCITGTSTRTSTWFVSDRYLLIRSTAVLFGCM